MFNFICRSNFEETNAFAIVSVEPDSYEEDQIAWTTTTTTTATNMASSAGLTLETVSNLGQYQLPQRVVIETLIPFNQTNADSDLTELVENRTIETDAIDSASVEDASMRLLEDKLDTAEISKDEANTFYSFSCQV